MKKTINVLLTSLLVFTLYGCFKTPSPPKYVENPYKKKSESLLRSVELKIKEINLISSLIVKYKDEASAVKLGFLKRDGYRVVPAFLYHNIAYLPKKNIDVSYGAFYKQMKYFYDNGYRTITTKQLYNFLNLKSEIPEKSILLTFDYGSSMYYLLSSILEEFGFHGVLFVNPYATEEKLSINWSWIKELKKGSVEVHLNIKNPLEYAIWNGESETRAKVLDKKIMESKNLLEKKIGKKTDFIAYSHEIYSPELLDLLKNKYAYKGAFTVIEKKQKKYGTVSFFNNPFEISRFTIRRDTDFEEFKGYLKTFEEEATLDEAALNNFRREIGILNARYLK